MRANAERGTAIRTGATTPQTQQSRDFTSLGYNPQIGTFESVTLPKPAAHTASRPRPIFAVSARRLSNGDIEESGLAFADFRRLIGRGAPLIAAFEQTVRRFHPQRIAKLLQRVGWLAKRPQ